MFIMISLKIFLTVIHNYLVDAEKADKIIVIENGEIVEIGTQNELWANKEHYAKYYNLQYKVKTSNEDRE